MEFADIILEEKDLVKKIEIISFLKKKEKIFFDTSVILKAEITKQFMDIMNIDVDKNKVITACLVYGFKRINSPQEIQRIKKEGKLDYEYLKSLGFNDRFCKICSEYNRYNEKEGYVREKEGDILELVDNFGGLIMHRPERLAFPIEDAIQVLEYKNLHHKNNRYLEEFKKFINIMEAIETKRMVGSYTKLQNCFNMLKREDIAGAVRAIYDHEDRIAIAIGLDVDGNPQTRLENVGKFSARLMELNKIENEEKKGK